MKPETRTRYLGGLLALFLASPAWCGDEAPDYGQTLSGDASGWRAALFRRGIQLDAAYKADLLRNVRGGIAPGGGAIGHLDIQWRADLEKLWAWEGASAFVNFIDDRGKQVNGERVGSLLGVSNIEVPKPTHRFFHAWVQKAWDDGRLAVLAGLYPVDSEFAVMDSAGLFVQPPYGAWADYALSSGPSIFNNSSFGARIKWQSESRDYYAQAAILDGRPGDPNHPVGTHVRFGNGDGTQIVAEVGYAPRGEEGGAEAFEKFLAGYWRYTSRVADLVDADANGEAVRRRSDGWYLAAERTILRGEGERNLAVFARYSFNDGNVVVLRDALNLGLRVRGLLPGARADDICGIAWTRAATSGKFRAAQAAAGIEATAFEDAVELSYRFKATPWLAIQPLFQRIRHPGADRAVPSASVVGVRLEFSL